MDIYLCCFHIVTIVNGTAMNADVRVSVVGNGVLGIHAQEWCNFVVW